MQKLALVSVAIFAVALMSLASVMLVQTSYGSVDETGNSKDEEFAVIQKPAVDRGHDLEAFHDHEVARVAEAERAELADKHADEHAQVQQQPNIAINPDEKDNEGHVIAGGGSGDDVAVDDQAAEGEGGEGESESEDELSVREIPDSYESTTAIGDELHVFKQRWAQTPSDGMHGGVPHVFIHLAKTGGTTLGSLFQELWRTKTKIIWAPPQKREGVGADLKNKDIVFGHIPYGFHKWLGPPELENNKFAYATMLRDPVARVISHYYYHKERVSDPNHKRTIGRDLKKWVQDVEYGKNQMTVYIAGATSGSKWNDDVMIGPNHDVPLLMPPRDPGAENNDHWIVTEELFEVAKYNLLHNIAFVGLTERFDETKELLGHFMGWKGLASHHLVKNKNSNKPKRDALDDETLEAVRAANAYDIKLYELATRIFDAQVEAYGGEEKLKAAVGK